MESSEVDIGGIIITCLLAILVGLILIIIYFVRQIFDIPQRTYLLNCILNELKLLNSKTNVKITEKSNQLQPILKNGETICKCPVCKEKQSIPIEYSGRQVKCQICKSEFLAEKN
jgi:hypothetical protein